MPLRGAPLPDDGRGNRDGGGGAPRAVLRVRCVKDLAVALAERKARHLYRSRQVTEGPADVEVTVGGRRYLSFCSNDYLGLAAHPAVAEALREGATRFGAGSGAAHLITGHSRAHHALEEELADFTGRPRALLFSTGYMANLGVISALAGHGDRVFEDRGNHASLLDGARLSGARLVRYRHAAAEDLERCLLASPPSERLVATDGVFSMDGDIAPLQDLAAVARRHGARLMVDDAHGFGVTGPDGRGSVSGAGLDTRQVPILMATLGKALGTFGAFVAGEDVLIETLIQQARPYIYTTAPPPAVAWAARAALGIVRTEQWRRDHLGALIRQFRAGAATLGLPLLESGTPIQPLITGTPKDALELDEALRAQGVLVSAIRPPTVPPGGARLRITLSANHREAHVRRLLEALDTAFQGRVRRHDPGQAARSSR
jgi:8-amino-7-oxononanoate synthase